MIKAVFARPSWLEKQIRSLNTMNLYVVRYTALDFISFLMQIDRKTEPGAYEGRNKKAEHHSIAQPCFQLLAVI